MELLYLILISIIFIFLLAVNVSDLRLFRFLKIMKKPSIEKPVYMLINVNVLDEKKLSQYQDKAVPLARVAGCQLLASAEPVVLDGEWPYRGELVLEKFSSMKALREYWYSEEYQEARKALQGADIRDFTIAIEAWK